MASDANSVDGKILFIGNSYTSRNDLPRLIADLAVAAPKPKHLHVQSIVAGGASLRRHWNAGAARTALEAVRWDHVASGKDAGMARHHVGSDLHHAIPDDGARDALQQ